ncbi:MerR family transcriptional regulator, partial [Streptomyces prunicolor]|uniref:MerR family transcriptional regulator n=1 Tax=Streptomyces prunicolor TaxID=67348 RepID=UPI0033CC9E30
MPAGGDAAYPSAAEVPLTTGALARRLGVAPTTLRSWERRYGIGPAVRAEGRHRRWTPRDVALLEEMCRLTSSGVPPAEAAKAAADRRAESTRFTRDFSGRYARRGRGGSAEVHLAEQPEVDVDP